MKKSLKAPLLLVCLGLFAAQAFAARPDAALTPGELCTPDDADFAGYRYPAHVAYCKRNVTYAEKQAVAKAYGVPESEWRNYEFDHLIPLNAGGDSHPANIWPQPLNEAKEKDKVELLTYEGLRDGTLSQEQAVQMIWDWVADH